MSPAYNPNMLDQNLDIGGSRVPSASKTLSDEPAGLGQAITGGGGASLTSLVGSTVTVTGLSGMTTNSIGNFITITGASIPANNGTFPIVGYTSPSSISFTNPSASLPDGGSIGWTQRLPYSLADDLNFERTDRQAIKGVNYYDSIPVYQRPTATNVNVDASLANIAGKTTDARGLIINEFFYRQSVSSGQVKSTLFNTGNLRHSDSIDKTGVPCWDVAPYSGNYLACYTELLDGYSDGELLVLSGPHIGEKIFGLTNNGSSSSPDSVEVIFYSCPIGKDFSIYSTPYTWEIGQSSLITCIYGYFKRLDLLADEDLRRSLSGGGGGTTAVQPIPQLLNSFLFGGM